MKTRRLELSDRLEVLRPVLATWVERIEAVTDSFPQSLEQYFLEATLVGLLAGAAWSNGMQAITEVKARRRFGDGNEARGQLDLLVRSSAGLLIAMEAKIFWDHVLAPKAIDSWLNDACREVGSIVNGAGDIMLGAVFFVPWWRTQAEKAQLEANVLPVLGEVQADIKALYYDHDADFPGAMLIAREAIAIEAKIL